MEREFREYSRPVFGNGKRDSRSREFPGIFPILEPLQFTELRQIRLIEIFQQILLNFKEFLKILITFNDTGIRGITSDTID